MRRAFECCRHRPHTGIGLRSPAERLAAWRQNKAAYASVHGEDAYRAQELFYTVIARLYDSGSLGGVRLVARLP